MTMPNPLPWLDELPRVQKIIGAIVFLVGGVGVFMNWLFRRPKPKSVVERLSQFQLEEAETKCKYDTLSEQLEFAWTKYATQNVAANNDYFPEAFVANLINVRVEEFRKVAAYMGEDRIGRITVNGESLYRVFSESRRRAVSSRH